MENYLNVFLIGGGVQIVNPRRRCLRRSVPVDGATSECSIVLEQSVDDEPVHDDAEDGRNDEGQNRFHHVENSHHFVIKWQSI